MNVNVHETNNRSRSKAFCFDSASSTLQIQEEIYRQLNAERNQGIANYQFYYDEMEKIHTNTFDGGVFSLSEESLKADEYLGDLGTESMSAHTVINTTGRFDGFC